MPSASASRRGPHSRRAPRRTRRPPHRRPARSASADGRSTSVISPSLVCDRPSTRASTYMGSVRSRSAKMPSIDGGASGMLRASTPSTASSTARSSIANSSRPTRNTSSSARPSRLRRAHGVARPARPDLAPRSPEARCRTSSVAADRRSGAIASARSEDGSSRTTRGSAAAPRSRGAGIARTGSCGVLRRSRGIISRTIIARAASRPVTPVR